MISSKKIKLGFLFGILLLISFCGRRTAPRPLEEITEGLPLLLSSKSFYRKENLHIQWRLPPSLIKTKKKKSRIQVKSYKINILRPSSRCGNCEPENLGYFLFDTADNTLSWKLSFIPRKKPLSNQIEYENGWFSLVLYPENLPDNLSLFTINYQTEEGRLSGKTIALYPRRPLELPIPKIIKVIQFADFTHIVWEKKEELVRTHFNSEGKRPRMIGYFGMNFYSKSEKGKFVLLNSTPYRGNKIDLKSVKQPIYARFIDRFSNESAIIEVNIKIPVDR